MKSEADSEQPILVTVGPRPGKAEALAQPQHRLEALDRAPGREEGLEAADPRHVLLESEVGALNALLQVFGHVVEWNAGQKAVTPRRHDRGRIGAGTIRADPVRREQRLILQHLAEEPLGRFEIALGGQEEVDGIAMLVDGSVEVASLAAHLDVRFVDPNRATVRLTELPQPFLDHGSVGQNSTVQCAVIDLQAALQEQLLDVAVTERVSQVPGDRLH